MRYAENTSVSVENSKAEIERILQRYGASHFMSGWDQKAAYIAFNLENRMIKFVLELPSKDLREFTHTPSRGTVRSSEKALVLWEQACRQKWRALSLIIKAKLEAVESGIAEFEDEFLANIVLPDGSTVSNFIKPQIEIAYNNGKMPKLLPFSVD